MPASALGPGTLEIGSSGSTKALAAETTAATLTPSTNSGDAINFLDGSTDAGEVTETWTLEVTLAQNYDSSSAINWLLDNTGSQMPFTYRPRTDSQSTYSGTLTVVSAAIGGDVKTKNTSDASFPLAGAPTRQSSGG